MNSISTQNSMSNTATAMNATSAPVGDIPFVDEAKDLNPSGTEIITFSTEQVPDVESIPEPMDLNASTLDIIQETRDHTIKDILCREYAIADGTIPTGGGINNILFRTQPLNALLQQSNVLEKISRFAIMRSDLELRVEFTAPPTIQGACMVTLYPDLHPVAINDRLRNRLQRSQAPRQEIVLSTVKSLYMRIPWISAFYGRNLLTGTGNIGEFVLSRIVPSATATATYKVYVKCDMNTLKIEYPTSGSVALPAAQLEEYINSIRQEQAEASRRLAIRVEHKITYDQLTAQQQLLIAGTRINCDGKLLLFSKIFKENDPRLSLINHCELERILGGDTIDIRPEFWQLTLDDLERAHEPILLHGKREVVQQEKKGKLSGILDAGSKVATIAAGVPVIGSVAAAAAPILSIGSKIAGLFGFSKTIAEKPIRPIRIKPADAHLSNEGVLPSHTFAITGNTSVKTDSGQFGSEADEMAIRFLERSTAIIADFRVATSTPVNTVVYAVPCTIAQYEREVGGEYFFTHQTWLANVMEKWLATLLFDINFTGNGFHVAKLRMSFNPNDTGLYEAGDVIPLNTLNALRGKVVAFGEQIPNNTISIEPVATTTMKIVPSTRNANGVGNDSTYDANRFTEQCSYGMLYITVEVPFRATSDLVAQYADFYVTFSTEDLILSHPTMHIPFAPRTQSDKRPIMHGIRDTISDGSLKASRSERFELKSSNYLSSTAMGTGVGNHLLSCGDALNSIKNILNAFYVFAPTQNVQAFQSIMIMPWAVRPINDQTVQQQFRFFDAFDYFAVGYGFCKGSMNIRLAKVDQSQPLGEVLLQSPTHNYINTTFAAAASQATGIATSTTTALARSGTRAIPIYSEECTPDFNIPFYSPFHIHRISTNGSTSFLTGRLDNRLIIQPYATQSYRIFRAVGDDFHFGTLTSLPGFVMDTTNVLS